MNNLEAKAIIEATGNHDEEDTEYIMDIYKNVVKHIGFEDKRRDKRYIVKFHDIFYYMPDGVEEAAADNLFERFCEDQADCISDALEEKHIDIDEMLHPMCVGHYQAFTVDIPEITKENAVEVAMLIYDEYGWRGDVYVDNYVYTVNVLQDLEDNYMDYWIEFLEANEYMPKPMIDEIRERYKKDMERRKAKQTLAK